MENHPDPRPAEIVPSFGGALGDRRHLRMEGLLMSAAFAIPCTTHRNYFTEAAKVKPLR
jgi:hypothetical protein